MIHSVYAERRRKLIEQLRPNSIVGLRAAPEYHKDRDVTFPYRQDPDFFYLTGYPETDAIAVIAPKRIDGEYILFIREKSEKEKQWIGGGVTKQEAMEIYGADQVFPYASFSDVVPNLLDGRSHVYYPVNGSAELSKHVMDSIQRLKRGVRAGMRAPSDLIDLSKILHEMRLIKDEEEIKILKKTAQMTAAGHVRAMRKCKPGMYEYELKAEAVYEFYKHGASGESFETIVAGGKNACILHYVENQDPLEAGKLVLIDAGAEYQHYTGDLTRTFPVNGRFSGPQRDLYQVVLAAQLAAIDTIKPGVAWDDLQEITIYRLAQGLLDLGIIEGSLDEVIESKTYRHFYMHHLSHWIGMNVHDDGDYKVDDHWRKLQPGMLMSIEPGLYIPDWETIDAKWRGIGIRIEDEALVTEKGCEILTQDAPKTIEDIEDIMND
ncbi:MAG: Xaa-Pro aminopeptidase [Gammaproteobacteria bacterium RIFOXYB2_FULL_38_6]|nr:MAG: Xaa-Pro aminopeptidase [Gammaproteobacteria bacterium RIFOXYB2_FULL_38_6]